MITSFENKMVGGKPGLLKRLKDKLWTKKPVICPHCGSVVKDPDNCPYKCEGQCK